MSVEDRNIHQDAKFGRHCITLPLITAVSQTGRPAAAFMPGYRYRVTGVQAYAAVLAGNVTAWVVNARATDILSSAALAIHSTPEEFAVGKFTYSIAGVLKLKAAATAIAFAAADTINVGTDTGFFWGAWLVQIDASGTITTKPAGGYTDQVFTSEAQAVSFLPAATAANVAIGYITVAANEDVAWTANTSDMTDASDCLTTDFYNYLSDGAIHSTVLTFASLSELAATLSTTLAKLRGAATDRLVVLYTSDGSGALTNGQVHIQIRPEPLMGEVMPQ